MLQIVCPDVSFFLVVGINSARRHGAGGFRADHRKRGIILVEPIDAALVVIESLHVLHLGGAFSAPAVVHRLGDRRGNRRWPSPRASWWLRCARRVRFPARALRCPPTRSRSTDDCDGSGPCAQAGSALRAWNPSCGFRTSSSCPAGRRRRRVPAWADCARCGSAFEPISLSRSMR